jgi:predicted dehydrogenase
MGKIRVGVIGCGGIASGTHVPNYLKLQDVSVVACADIDESRARDFAKRFNIPAYYKDYRDMLNKENLDAVSVCTPNVAHKDPSIAAMKAGAHVLVEKPMAASLKDAAEMWETSKKTNRILIVGFQTRFSPSIVLLRNVVASGELGSVYYARALHLRRWGIPPSPTFIDVKLSGGGALLDIGCYAVDTAMYVLDFPEPKTVTGVTYARFGKNKKYAEMGCWGSKWKPEEFQVEDMAVGFVRFENGLSMMVETSWASYINSSGVFNLVLLGDEGGAQMDPPEIYKGLELEELKRRAYGPLNLAAKPIDNLPNVDIYYMRIANFIESVKLGKPLFSPADEGIKVQAILDAIYKSAALNREVEVEKPWKS